MPAELHASCRELRTQTSVPGFRYSPAMSVDRAAQHSLFRRWRWPAVALVLVGGLAILVLVRAKSSTGDTSSLTPAEIVRRSGEAMAAISLLRVESAKWPIVPLEDTVFGIDVVEYTRDTARQIHSPVFVRPGCPAQDFNHMVFTNRERGGFAYYDQSYAKRGATGPADFELLREETIDGEEAWVVRYSFTFPSIETPVRIEDTEWIAKSDYRLLRQERLYLDGQGFSGQIVSVPIPITARATNCPSKPIHSVQDLTPLTPRPTFPPS